MAYVEEFVAAGDFLAYKFPVWSWYVDWPKWVFLVLMYLQGKGRVFQGARLPACRQAISRYSERYVAHDPSTSVRLVCSSVPCLRRATSLAYTDADEDAEKLLSFADDSSKGDEWVQTHAGRRK